MDLKQNLNKYESLLRPQFSRELEGLESDVREIRREIEEDTKKNPKNIKDILSLMKECTLTPNSVFTAVGSDKKYIHISEKWGEITITSDPKKIYVNNKYLIDWDSYDKIVSAIELNDWLFVTTKRGTTNSAFAVNLRTATYYNAQQMSYHSNAGECMFIRGGIELERELGSEVYRFDFNAMKFVGGRNGKSKFFRRWTANEIYNGIRYISLDPTTKSLSEKEYELITKESSITYLVIELWENIEKIKLWVTLVGIGELTLIINHLGGSIIKIDIPLPCYGGNLRFSSVQNGDNSKFSKYYIQQGGVYGGTYNIFKLPKKIIKEIEKLVLENGVSI